MSWKGNQTTWDEFSPSLQRKLETMIGEKGDPGEQGQPGPPGPPGPEADLTEVNQGIANLQQTVTDNQKVVTEHLDENVASESGAHDLRYYNEELAYKDGDDWVEISTGNKVKEFTGNLNDLTETGMYYHTGDYSNSPVPAPAIVDVVQSPDGLTVMQVWREKRTNASYALNTRRQATRDDLSTPFVWGNVVDRSDPGFLKGWQRMYPLLSDSITSALTNEVATANAVKKVNDKLIDTKVLLGKDANTYGAIGVAIGAESFASNQNYAVAIGYRANSPNVGEGVLGGATNINTNVWKVPGSLSVSGTKNFELPHPHPDKKHTHVIRHGAVESPTTGDTLYRYTIESITDGETVNVQLPDYFEYLNTNVDVWVNPVEHFGRAYGKVVGDKLLVTCEKIGLYKALVIGTRNDDNVQDWYIKGVEREVGESWLGETYVFEVDEITEVTEFEEVLQ